MRLSACLATCLIWVLVGVGGPGCSGSNPPAPTVTQESDKMPPEVIYDPESAMQKYGRPDGRN